MSDLPVYSFAPREGHGISAATATEFEALGVVHDERHLNVHYPDYPLANKVKVCAYAERVLDYHTLVFLDSDQIIWNEPSSLRLAPGEDAAVQPELRVGIGAGSPQDENYNYWVRLLDRYSIDSPYHTRTLIEGREIFGYWNSGIMAVRREAGLFARWETIFEDIWREDIWPDEGDHRYYTEQMSFGLALMSMRAALRTLPGDYNYHVVAHDEIPASMRHNNLAALTTMHHHKLLRKSPWQRPFKRLTGFEAQGERYEWLREQMRELGIGRPGGLTGVLAWIQRQLHKRRGEARRNLAYESNSNHLLG